MSRPVALLSVLVLSLGLAGVVQGEEPCIDYNDYLHWLPHNNPDELWAYHILTIGNQLYLSDGDLQVYDLADPDEPQLIGTLPDIGGPVGLSGEYLVCNSNGVQIVDIGDPSEPELLGSNADRNNELAADGVLAVGTYRSMSSDYLRVHDLSDPSAPTLVAEIFVTGQSSQGIDIEGDLAFALYSDFFQPVDLSDPTNPQLGTPYYNANVYHRGIHLDGDRLCILSEQQDDLGRLQIFAVGDPDSPTLLGEEILPRVSYPRLFVDGDLAYVVDESLEQLFLVDISDETDPRFTGQIYTRFEATAVAAGHDRAYVVGHPIEMDGGYQPSWLRIANVANIEAPPAIGELAIDSTWEMALSAGLAYVIGDGGLYVVDLADPAAPAQLGQLPLPAMAYKIVVAGNLGYVLVNIGSNDPRLLTIDLSDPAAPLELDNYQLPGDISRDLVFQDQRLFIAISEGFAYEFTPYLAVVDVAIPGAPALDAYVPAYDLGRSESIVLSDDGRHAIVGLSNISPSLAIFDIQDPESPLVVARASSPGAMDLALAGDRLYSCGAASLWGMGDGLVNLLDVSDPTDIQLLTTLRLASPSDDFALSDAGLGGGIPSGLFYVAGNQAGIQCISALDEDEMQEIGTWSGSCRRVADAGGFLVGLQRNFGLITIPYHCALTAAGETPLARLPLAAQPNPFNPSTTLHFSLAAAGPVQLTIHDVSGRQVARLHGGELPAGRHQVTWDGRDKNGQALASGVYLAHLTTATGSAGAKLLLLK